MEPSDRMRGIDTQLAHVWMVRTFIKHSTEAEEDDRLRDAQRDLYDYILALGPSWQAQDADQYLKLAHKKFARLKRACETFAEIQPEISTHTNFQMAVASLATAVGEIGALLPQSGKDE